MKSGQSKRILNTKNIGCSKSWGSKPRLSVSVKAQLQSEVLHQLKCAQDYLEGAGNYPMTGNPIQGAQITASLVSARQNEIAPLKN